MARKLTRAERYKRNYRIIKNAYQDTTLAKQGQTWSDERIYNDLGLNVNKKTPKLKSITADKKPYYTRKLNKFLYGRSVGFGVKEAKKFSSYQKAKIQSSYDYQDANSKQRNFKNKERRLKLWKDWSSHPKSETTNNFPPEIEKIARERNRLTKLNNGKALDDYAHFGYVVAFYQFVEGKDYEDIKDTVKPDPNDSYEVMYKETVRAV